MGDGGPKNTANPKGAQRSRRSPQCKDDAALHQSYNLWGRCTLTTSLVEAAGAPFAASLSRTEPVATAWAWEAVAGAGDDGFGASSPSSSLSSMTRFLYCLLISASAELKERGGPASSWERAENGD